MRPLPLVVLLCLGPACEPAPDSLADCVDPACLRTAVDTQAPDDTQQAKLSTPSANQSSRATYGVRPTSVQGALGPVAGLDSPDPPTPEADPRPPVSDELFERITEARSCDADDDGYDASRCGGDDCDDQNPNVHPRAGDQSGDGLDPDCDGLDCEATLGADGSYLAVCLQPSDWIDGVQRCERAGYQLATVRSKVDQSRVEALLNQATDPLVWSLWIGLTDASEPGRWRWVGGQESRFTHWADGWLNNREGEHCAVLNWPPTEGTWDDQDCDEGGLFYGFVCQGL